jgi:predicted flap endonuclease-1-like 5' DNA nuclease
MRVHQLRGIQMSTADKLAAAGVPTAEALLEAGRTPAGRRDLAAKAAIDANELLELVNRADLARVRGIGEVYSNLLENAGVDTVVELSRRVPANLHAKLVEQTLSGDARRAPTLAQVEDWVRQAKDLGRGVEY